MNKGEHSSSSSGRPVGQNKELTLIPLLWICVNLCHHSFLWPIGNTHKLWVFWYNSFSLGS